MTPTPGPRRCQLLVSVRSAEEAEAALAGGADLIDVKEPRGGSLGRAEDWVLAGVLRRVSGRRPVSAAMGGLRGQESGVRSQGSGVRGQESGVRSQGSEHPKPTGGAPWDRLLSSQT